MILKAETFLEKHYRKAVLGIFILSLALSLIYYLQGRNTPIITYHKWENSDMAFFDAWAKHITAGDWWGHDALHPFHSWHAEFAIEYFKQFPDVASKYNYVANDTPDAIHAQKAFINDIYKGKTFHQEPLYTYLIAITYSIFGTDVKWVFFWQFLLAAFACALVFLIGRHLFGALTGLVASLFVALCGSIKVYEMVLFRTTLTIFFTVLLLYLFLKLMEKPNVKRSVFFGAASGFALLAQSYFILFLFPALIWLIWQHRKQWKAKVPVVLVSLSSMLIVMLPLFIRNIKEGLSIGSMASHGAITYVPMNIKDSAPMDTYYIHFPSLARIFHDTQGKMIPAVFASLRTFDSLGSFFKIYKQKIDGLFMWWEIPNNMNYYLYRELAPILKIIPVRYFFIAPLGLAGLILGLWKHRRQFAPLLLMTAVCIVPLLIAGNLARIRAPFVIMMCLFAAFFVIEILSLLYRRKWSQFWIGLGVALIAFVYIPRVVPKNQFLWYGFDFTISYLHFYMDKLKTCEREQKYEECLTLTTNMINKLPDYFMTVDLNKKIVRAKEADASRSIITMLQSHRNVLNFHNKKQEAAYYDKRINILQARIDDYHKRAAIQ